MNKHPDNAPEGIYHAETVEACARVAEAQYAKHGWQYIVGNGHTFAIAAAIRALPTTPPAPLQADDAAEEIARLISPALDWETPLPLEGEKGFEETPLFFHRHSSMVRANSVLARLAITPAPDTTGDAMVEALQTLLAEARERGGALSNGERLGCAALAVSRAPVQG